MGVIDLQDLYDLPGSNLCDLYDLFTGMGYVRSAWYAHFYRWVRMVSRICMICGIFVWSGGCVKSEYLTLVCIMFSRDGPVWGGYVTREYLSRIRVICASLPGWMCKICRICMVLGGICAIWMICTPWARCDQYDLQDLYDLQDFCMIWGICKSWILVSACLATTGAAR